MGRITGPPAMEDGVAMADVFLAAIFYAMVVLLIAALIAEFRNTRVR